MEGKKEAGRKEEEEGRWEEGGRAGGGRKGDVATKTGHGDTYPGPLVPLLVSFALLHAWYRMPGSRH